MTDSETLSNILDPRIPKGENKMGKMDTIWSTWNQVCLCSYSSHCFLLKKKR